MAIAVSIDIEAGVHAGVSGAGKTVPGKATAAAALGGLAQSSGTSTASFRSSWQSMLEALGASLDGAESSGGNIEASSTRDGGAALAASAKSATAASASSFGSAVGLQAGAVAIGEQAGLRTSGGASWQGNAAQVARQAARSGQADSSDADGRAEKTDASDSAQGAGEGKSSDWKKKSGEDAQSPAVSANAAAVPIAVVSLSQMPVQIPVQTPMQAAPEPAAEWSQKSLTLAGSGAGSGLESSGLGSSGFGSSDFGGGKDIVPGVSSGSGITAAVTGAAEKEASRAEHGREGLTNAGAAEGERGLTAPSSDGIRSAAAGTGDGISAPALPATAGGGSAEIGQTIVSAHSAAQKLAERVSAAGSAVASAGLGADSNPGLSAQANGADDAVGQLQGALGQASTLPGSALPGSAAELLSAAAPKPSTEKRAGDPGAVRAAHGASAGEVDRAAGVIVPLTGAQADAAAMGRGPGGGHQAAGPVIIGSGAAGAAGGTSGQGTFAALDAENGAKASWTHVGPRSAEAGFSDPSLGWVSVRADVGAGAVHASVVPGSAEAAQALGGHMAGLNTYLSGQQSSLATVTLAAPGSTGGDGGAGAMQQGTGDGRGQGANQGGSSETQSGMGVVAPSSSASALREVSATGGGLDRLASPFGQSGGHISVMA